MKWAQVLGMRPGVTAVIGGGGKTTLLRMAGETLAAAGFNVLLCTTTKIYPFSDLPCVTEPGEERLLAARAQSRLLCAGSSLDNGKLAAPAVPMARLKALFDYVLVEADGSAHLPLKAHAPHEPVIPPEAGEIICVVGASGFGKPIREVAHRPERYAALAGAGEGDLVTPRIAAKVLKAEKLHTGILINQAELAAAQAQELVRLLNCPAVAGSLKLGKLF
ncbi:selenium cofactor biosynthesis protein YqeC [Oscillibacter sp.]|uniref:selenium cofactor biosynthesis protein YqeC n=1 Tax=Oscillibacter sp. TaxID=1945593 RepID=UPI0028A80A1E|nr:selenium cofactor biosynthesis protein YqeC [Oscillibacter sp.]